MIKVLVVDDSNVMRKIISKIFSSHKMFDVVTAEDPYEARKLIKSYRPHVITLDIEMPRMDGITFLKNLMRLNPLPVVMLSTLTQKGAQATLVAMEQGAIDFIGKPKANTTDEGLVDFAASLVEKVKVAAASYHIVKSSRSLKKISETRKRREIPADNVKGKVIAIGSSTGGIEALNALLEDISTQLPPIIITQHLPESFSRQFAKRLNNNVNIEVQLAEQDTVLKPGCVYLAAGGKHLKIANNNGKYQCHLDGGNPVNMHRPSVDVMFESLNTIPAKDVLLVLLTGMGKDGAKAMKKLSDQGATCVAQDENTSVVWGMPGAAVALDCVDVVLPLAEISTFIEDRY